MEMAEDILSLFPPPFYQLVTLLLTQKKIQPSIVEISQTS